jgi:hypothetical protein
MRVMFTDTDYAAGICSKIAAAALGLKFDTAWEPQ